MFPFTRLTTYLANSVPAIKALDLNTIQDYLTHLFNGAKTLIKLQVDGTGDAATTCAAGEIQCSKAVIVGEYQAGSVLPTTAIPLNRINAGKTCFGWATVGSAGTFGRGDNVKAVTRVALGHYRVTFHGQVVDQINMSPFWSSWTSGRRCDYTTTGASGTDTVLNLYWVDNTDAAADADFSCGLFGE